jgi:hypothetical protein
LLFVDGQAEYTLVLIPHLREGEFGQNRF